MITLQSSITIWQNFKLYNFDPPSVLSEVVRWSFHGAMGRIPSVFQEYLGPVTNFVTIKTKISPHCSVPNIKQSTNDTSRPTFLHNYSGFLWGKMNPWGSAVIAGGDCKYFSWSNCLDCCDWGPRYFWEECWTRKLLPCQATIAINFRDHGLK